MATTKSCNCAFPPVLWGCYRRPPPCLRECLAAAAVIEHSSVTTSAPLLFRWPSSPSRRSSVGTHRIDLFSLQ
jgi:hypothetical protein